MEPYVGMSCIQARPKSWRSGDKNLIAVAREDQEKNKVCTLSPLLTNKREAVPPIDVLWMRVRVAIACHCDWAYGWETRLAITRHCCMRMKIWSSGFWGIWPTSWRHRPRLECGMTGMWIVALCATLLGAITWLLWTHLPLEPCHTLFAAHHYHFLADNFDRTHLNYGLCNYERT